MKKILLNTFWCMALVVSSSIFAQQKAIEISSKRNDDNSVTFSYEKNVPGTYSVDVKFKRLVNGSTTDFQAIANGKRGILYTVRPIDKTKPINYSYSYVYGLGQPKPKIDREFCYTLPLQKDSHAKINESSFVGETQFGSEKPENWKFFNYSSDVAEQIYAMRKGVVVKLNNEYSASPGIGSGFTTKRNELIIEHKDGTYARYVGFAKDSFKVKLGQTVYPQTLLGTMVEQSHGKYLFSFAVYYRTSTDFDKYKRSTLNNQFSMQAYVNPFFMTEEGPIQIEAGNYYTVGFNEELYTKEFSRREKKKFKKDPESIK